MNKKEMEFEIHKLKKLEAINFRIIKSHGRLIDLGSDLRQLNFWILVMAIIFLYIFTILFKLL